jgi:hypothetical protein
MAVNSVQPAAHQPRVTGKHGMQNKKLADEFGSASDDLLCGLKQRQLSTIQVRLARHGACEAQGQPMTPLPERL